MYSSFLNILPLHVNASGRIYIIYYENTKLLKNGYSISFNEYYLLN